MHALFNVRTFQEILENIRTFQKILGNFRKYQEILENIRKFQEIFENNRKFQEILENVRKCLEILGNVRKCQEILGQVRKFQKCRPSSFLGTKSVPRWWGSLHSLHHLAPAPLLATLRHDCNNKKPDPPVRKPREICIEIEKIVVCNPIVRGIL